MTQTPAEIQETRLGSAFYQRAPGDQRQPSPEVPRTPVGGPVPLTRPGLEKYARQQERNQKLYLCCRHPENMTAQRFKSHPGLPGPDLLVAACDLCGRRHTTLKVGAGERPDPEWAR